MPNKVSNLLVNALNIDRQFVADSDQAWEMLIRQARAAGVLARLAYLRYEFKLLSPPPGIALHFESAHKYWLSQQRIVEWELFNLKSVFAQLDLPLILLKGTAYLTANLDAGGGRVFSDIDILVPFDRLSEVQQVLKYSGWFPESLNAYDQNYYHRWMHELPPLRHVKRGTSLDVHHNILPRTCSLCPDAQVLIDDTVEIGDTGFWTLSPHDMVLHSACHLFWGGEFDNGLRDLSDIDLLLRQFSTRDSDFWYKLVTRAQKLELTLPLAYALNCARSILGSPIPQEIEKSLLQLNNGHNIRLMSYFFSKAFRTFHPSCDEIGSGFVRWLLYVRSHWLKMPWYLLIPHLCRKAWMRLTGKETH